jgi:hypothetical protein
VEDENLVLYRKKRSFISFDALIALVGFWWIVSKNAVMLLVWMFRGGAVQR